MLQSREYQAFAADIKVACKQFMRHTGGLLALILLVMFFLTWLCSRN